MSPLLVITPTLECDSLFAASVRSVAEVLLGQVDYIHAIVGPPALAAKVAEFSGLNFIPEAAGTKGVFDAVSQAVHAGGDRWKASRATYINHDDLLLPGFATLARSAMQSEAEIDYGRVWWIDGEGRRLFRMPVWPYHRGLAELFAAGVSPLTQQGLVFSTAAYLRAGGFDPSLRFMADSDLWFRLLYGGAKAQYHGEDVAAFRIRPGQLSGNIRESALELQALQRRRRQRFPISAGRRRSWFILFKLRFIPTYLARLLRGHGLRTLEKFERLPARGTKS